jgi:hypothetical protein
MGLDSTQRTADDCRWNTLDSLVEIQLLDRISALIVKILELGLEIGDWQSFDLRKHRDCDRQTHRQTASDQS